MALEFVGSIPDDQWQPLFREHLDRADEFRVRMPDGEGMLSAGRNEFRALPGVDVRPWTGMRDAIEITGELTGEARELFLSMEESIKSYDHDHKLWDYQLLAGGEVILSIGDFTDLMIDKP